MSKYDIPINFTVEAKTETEAVATLHGLLDRVTLKYGLENLVAYEDFEFIAKEPSHSRCGDNHCC